MKDNYLELCPCRQASSFAGSQNDCKAWEDHKTCKCITHNIFHSVMGILMLLLTGRWALSVKLQTGFPSCGDMRVNAYFAVEATHKSLVASSLPIAGIEGG